MTSLRKMMFNELTRMQQLQQQVEKRLETAPEGRLRISKSMGNTQFYIRLSHIDNNGKYISKSEIDLTRALAQKSYDEKILKCVRKRANQFSRILSDYRDDEIEQIYLSEHPTRQNLINNIVEPTWTKQLDEWLAIPYKGKPFKDDAPVILTERGMRDRSKSEKILADYFDRNNIKYKYECPLYLENYGYVYPDFTFLSHAEKKEIYWEHDGMMDDPAYARMAVKKIESYEANGIYPGERLILTFETSETFINTNIIRDMAERYLK